MLVEKFPGQLPIRELHEVLGRRARYLIGRAGISGERGLNDSSPQWRDPLAEATLWMEAAESKVALAEFVDARRCLTRAVDLLLSLRLPLGAALQRAFGLFEDGLSERANGVVDAWRNVLDSGGGLFERDNDIPRPPIEGAFDVAQQWAYYALATAGEDAWRKGERLASEDELLRTRGMYSAPVGRLRHPLRDYFTVAMATRAAVIGDDEPGVPGRSDAVEVLARSLVGLYNMLQYASENTFLWRRLLSPAPMFDLDTALLIARMAEAGLATKVLERMDGYARFVSSDATGYAYEFLGAVDLLRVSQGNNMRSL